MLEKTNLLIKNQIKFSKFMLKIEEVAFFNNKFYFSRAKINYINYIFIISI